MCWGSRGANGGRYRRPDRAIACSLPPAVAGHVAEALRPSRTTRNSPGVAGPFLAYRMQEHAYGGLKSSARSELRRIARDLEKSAGSTRLILRPKMKAGTRLLREWRGQTHEVIATESGYEYRGVGYRSLSEIARKVTGTRWSGPAFFGLKNAKSGLGLRDD